MQGGPGGPGDQEVGLEQRAARTAIYGSIERSYKPPPTARPADRFVEARGRFLAAVANDAQHLRLDAALHTPGRPTSEPLEVRRPSGPHPRARG